MEILVVVGGLDPGHYCTVQGLFPSLIGSISAASWSRFKTQYSDVVFSPALGAASIFGFPESRHAECSGGYGDTYGFIVCRTWVLCRLATLL
jgi:hypothetical protein